MKTITKIEKEELPQFSFAREEVIQNPEERKMRMADLNRSQTLGNLLQTKVRITFEDKERNIYEVYTTVWAVGIEFVSLKGGVTLPICSIVNVT